MSGPSPILATLEARYPGARLQPNGWTAVACPVHDDQHASFGWSVAARGRVRLKCHAGCSTDAIAAALGHGRRDLFPPSEKRRPRAGDGPLPVGARGLTVDELAARKRLDPQALRARGVRDVRLRGVATVLIPYRDEGGEEVALRYRDGAGHRWRRGDHVRFYGLERHTEIRAQGWALLPEGETDSWTADHYGIPALGIPGKATWRSDWAALVEGLEVVLCEEPDAADLTERVAVDLPEARVLILPPGIKDISEAHIAGHDVAALVNEARASGPTTSQLVATRRAEAAADALPDIARRAASVLAHPDPLTLLDEAIAMSGYGGDHGLVKLIFLAATTRLLALRPGAMPCHVLLLGLPSAGKTFALNVALGLLPAARTSPHRRRIAAGTHLRRRRPRSPGRGLRRVRQLARR